MNKKEILEWNDRYDKEELDYKEEKEIGENIRKNGFLTKEDLVKIIKWKFQGRLIGRQKRILNLIQDVSEEEIKKTSKEALSTDDEELKLEKLMSLRGIGVALSSVILSFYDPKKYYVYDIHVYDELFDTNSTTRPKNIFSNTKYYFDILKKLRLLRWR